MGKKVVFMGMIALWIWGSLMLSAFAQAPKPITLNYSKFSPAVHKSSQAPAEFFCSEIEKRTEGRVKVALFPGATLASPPETFDAVIKGVADIGQSLISYISGRFPATEICELPLGYPSAWVEGHVFTDFYNQFKPKEWENVVVLYMCGPPPGVIGTAKKPVRSFDDLKGLTIRSHAASASLVEAFGAVPRVMPITETYEALAKGVVDGVLAPFESFAPYKFSEVLRFATEARSVGYGSVVFIVMNKDSWKKISPDDQQKILKVGYDAMEMTGKMWDEDDKNGKKSFIAQQGREVITLPAPELAKLQTASQGVIDQWIKKKTEAGIPAGDYVKYLRERITYWSAKQP